LIYGAAHFQTHLLQEEELQLDVNNRVLYLLKQSLLLSGVGRGGIMVKRNISPPFGWVWK